MMSSVNHFLFQTLISYCLSQEELKRGKLQVLNSGRPFNMSKDNRTTLIDGQKVARAVAG